MSSACGDERVYVGQFKGKENNIGDDFISRKYFEFVSQNGYIPKMFQPYNCSEITNHAPTLATNCGMTTVSSTVLILEDEKPSADDICDDVKNICINDRGFVNKEPQLSYGYCPTLRAESHGNLPKVIVDAIYNNRPPRVYEDYAPTLRAERQGLDVILPTGCAMRGRYNPDGSTNQNLECHFDGIANTITTVGKDSMILEDEQSI